jgi:hypothetical protein
LFAKTEEEPKKKKKKKKGNKEEKKEEQVKDESNKGDVVEDAKRAVGSFNKQLERIKEKREEARLERERREKEK